MLQDMIHVYFAMVQYCILSCPYPLMVLILVTEGYFPIGMALWLLPWCFERVIRGGQQCLYQISRLFPALRDICSKMDLVLNSWGLWLENPENLDSNGKQKKRRVPVFRIYVLIVFVTVIFLIGPYYLETRLAGNSQMVCADINWFVEEKVAYIQQYVNQYYTPKIPEKEVPAETKEEIVEAMVEEVVEETVEERIVLHLGARGRGGSNLRSSPEKRSDNIVTTVYDDVELFFENEMQKTKGIIWVKVSTDEVPEAWISRNLLNEEEVAMFLNFEE